MKTREEAGGSCESHCATAARKPRGRLSSPRRLGGRWRAPEGSQAGPRCQLGGLDFPWSLGCRVQPGKKSQVGGAGLTGWGVGGGPEADGLALGGTRVRWEGLGWGGRCLPC